MAQPSRRPTPSPRGLPDLFETFLHARSASGPSPHTLAAYRRDLQGVAGRLAESAGVAPNRLRLRHLTKPLLRQAFSSWASDHAASSVLRAWSAWSSFFDHLVAGDLVHGNPMVAVARPRRPNQPLKVIRAAAVTPRLLHAAATPDVSARRQWIERDLALVGLFAVTGIRLGEALSLTLGSLGGPPGARRLSVTGRGGTTRTIPVDPALEVLVDRYLASRAGRVLEEDPGGPDRPLFIDSRGRQLTRDQVQYLVERLYVRAGMREEVPPGALVHALRHTFAAAALEGGADVLAVQELLGHASLDTTRRYVAAAAERLREAVAGHPGRHALHEFLGEADRSPSNPGRSGTGSTGERPMRGGPR